MTLDKVSSHRTGQEQRKQGERISSARALSSTEYEAANRRRRKLGGRRKAASVGDAGEGFASPSQLASDE